MKYKFLLYPLAFLSVFVPAIAAAQSGACGVSVTWQLTDGTLTISGEGDMYDNSYSAENFSYAIYSDDIKKVVVNEGVTSVGDHAFYQFKNLASVDLSSSIKSIGQSAFRETSLTDVAIPANVKDLKSYCFSNTRLEKVEIPASVTSVGERAFADNLFLGEVYWNASIPFEDIYEDDSSYSYKHIFYGDSIQLITFGPEAKNIYSHLMYGVTKVYDIKSSGNVEYLGCGALEGSKWALEHSSDDVLYFDKCLYSYGGGFNKPTHVEVKEGTVGISGYSFKGSRYLVGITVPETVSKVGYCPFEDCPSLSKVVWDAENPNTKSSLYGLSLFGKQLSEISFGDNVVRIPDSMCKDCTGLKSLVFPESLKIIGRQAFVRNTGVENVTFNANLDSIVGYAFEGCEKLKAVNLTARVIDYGAFFDCSNVTNITYSDNVRIIEGNSFNNAKIENLVLPSKLEKAVRLIPDGHIAKVVIECPDAAEVLSDAFPHGERYYNPPTINNMVFAEGVKNSQWFHVVDSVTISSTMTHIGGGEASTLIYKAIDSDDWPGIYCCNYVTICEGVQRIPGGLLYENPIKELVLPSSIKEIGYSAFSNCGELISVIAPWYDPREVVTDESALTNHNESAILYVPKGRVEAYRELSPWSTFLTIKEIDGSSEIDQVATPTISYENGALVFNCETPNAEYQYTITDQDIVNDEKNAGRVDLYACYEISVYATVPGLIKSPVATAKLYFIDATFESDGIEDITTRRGVLVSTSGSVLTLSGLSYNEKIEVYDIAGRLVGQGNAVDGVCEVSLDTDQSVVLVHTATETIKVKR